MYLFVEEGSTTLEIWLPKHQIVALECCTGCLTAGYKPFLDVVTALGACTRHHGTS